MGFDVYAENNEVEGLDYFRRNVWGWRPLWELASTVKNSGLTEEDIEMGYYNDGHLVTADKAKQLGTVLERIVESGEAAEYIAKRDEYLAGLEKEVCTHCNGTGQRNDEYVQGTCNACDGEGKREKLDTWYSLELEDVVAFANFVKQSGGFRIC